MRCHDDVNSTQHLARITRANLSRAWLKRTSCILFVCRLPKHSSSRAYDMFRTLLDPPLSSTLSTPVSSSLLFPQNWTNSCAANWTLVWPFCRTVSPHRLCAQRSGRGEQYRCYADTLSFKERKHWIDLLRRRHRYYTCCIGGA